MGSGHRCLLDCGLWSWLCVGFFLVHLFFFFNFFLPTIDLVVGERIQIVGGGYVGYHESLVSPGGGGLPVGARELMVLPKPSRGC